MSRLGEGSPGREPFERAHQAQPENEGFEGQPRLFDKQVAQASGGEICEGDSAGETDRPFELLMRPRDDLPDPSRSRGMAARLFPSKRRAAIARPRRLSGAANRIAKRPSA